MSPARAKERAADIEPFVLFRRGKRAIFVHGFAKSDADNISPDELKGFKKLAAIYLELTEEQIVALIEAKELMEVK